MQDAEMPDAAPSPATAAAHPYAIFRNRDFTLYLAGRLVAVLGQQMFAMAVGWELYERTGSALALGLVGLTLMVPMFLFTLPAGHIADNYSRKRIIVSMVNRETARGQPQMPLSPVRKGSAAAPAARQPGAPPAPPARH